MGFEPRARHRLLLVCRSSKDPVLRQELALALEERSMSLVPSTDLAREIDECPDCRRPNEGPSGRDGLCHAHRARWNLEACMARPEEDDMTGGYLERLVRRAIAAEPTGSSVLSALEFQARALDMVWEAHRRGAAQLPPGVAATLERARSAVPSYLRGGAAPTLHRRTRDEEQLELR
jgi:hypothetical protein